MEKVHRYALDVEWTGNTGEGTKDYRSYKRDYKIRMLHKPIIEGSSEVAFRGDITRHSPEDLFVASIAGCHMLWYLHLCADAGIVVTSYLDAATGSMLEDESGGGKFSEVVLHPQVSITDSGMVSKAQELHHKANELCYIARSCNFPIKHEAVISVAPGETLGG